VACSPVSCDSAGRVQRQTHLWRGSRGARGREQRDRCSLRTFTTSVGTPPRNAGRNAGLPFREVVHVMNPGVDRTRAQTASGTTADGGGFHPARHCRQDGFWAGMRPGLPRVWGPVWNSRARARQDPSRAREITQH